MTDLGFVDLSEDRDHFVRHQQLLVREDNEAAAQFALALYARASGQEVEWDEDGSPVVGVLFPHLPPIFSGAARTAAGSLWRAGRAQGRVNKWPPARRKRT
jgi:hypothetical protein